MDHSPAGSSQYPLVSVGEITPKTPATEIPPPEITLQLTPPTQVQTPSREVLNAWVAEAPEPKRRRLTKKQPDAMPPPETDEPEQIGELQQDDTDAPQVARVSAAWKRKAPDQVKITTSAHRLMWYEKGPAIAVRQMHGQKRQLAAVKVAKMSKIAAYKQAMVCVGRMERGLLEGDALKAELAKRIK